MLTPTYYTWSKSKKNWNRCRSVQTNPLIRQMYMAHLGEGERFYLRLLLHHIPGSKSFENMKTVDGIIHETYKAAATARGLLENDDEWDVCLNEASTFQDPSRLRDLFAIILLENNPQDSLAFWTRHRNDFTKDILHCWRTERRNPDLELNSHIMNKALQHVEHYLQSMGKSLRDFSTCPSQMKSYLKTVPSSLSLKRKLLSIYHA